MSKVIFLDIDGVLNAASGNEDCQMETSDGALIDEEKVKLLARLVRETDSDIILHSGWRFRFDSALKPLCKEAEVLVALLEKEDLHNTQIERHQVKPDQTAGLTPENVKQAADILFNA